MEEAAVAPTATWPKMPILQGVAWCALLLSLAALVAHILALPEQTVRLNWFHGDSLFPAHLAYDVLVDGGDYSQWRSPPAPFVFPDWPIVGGLVWLTGQPIIANLAFLCINYLVLTLAVLGCNRVVGSPYVAAREIWLLLSLSALLLAAATELSYMFPFLFMPAFHGGTCAWCMVAVYLILVAYRRGEKRPRAMLTPVCGLGLLSYVLGLSDLLTVLYLVAPITAAVLLSNFVTGTRTLAWRQQMIPLAVAAGCTILGAKTADWFVLRENPGNLSKLTPANILSNVTIFCESAWQYVMDGEFAHVAGLVLTILGVLVLAYLMVDRRRQWTPSHALQFMLVGYAILSVWSIVGGIVFGGSTVLWLANDYHFCTHYWLTALYMPFVVIPFVVTWMLARFPVQRGQLVTRLATIATGICVIGVLVGQVQRPKQYAAWDYQPKVVRQIDRIARQYDVHTGFVDYWEAREIGLFSSERLKALPITADSLQYFYWMTNKQWTRVEDSEATDRLAAVEFVVTGGLRQPGVDRQAVLRMFGQPTAEVELVKDDGLPASMMIYKRQPGRDGIEVALRGHMPALVRGGTAVHIAANRFQSQVGNLDGDTRTASGATDVAGYLLYGPYIPLQAGRYRIAANSAAADLSKDGSTHWDLGFIRPGTVEFQKLAGSVLTDDGYEISSEFEVPEEFSNVHIEFRVHFGGSGHLSVSNITFERLLPEAELANSAPLTPPNQSTRVGNLPAGTSSR